MISLNNKRMIKRMIKMKKYQYQILIKILYNDS